MSRTTGLAVSCLLVIAAMLSAAAAEASRIEELREKIESRNSEIEELEAEIREYEEKIRATERAAGTLSSRIESLDITRRRLASDITLTERRIENANNNIEALLISIAEQGDKITEAKLAIAKTLQEIKEVESQSLVEIVFQTGPLSAVLGKVNELASLQEQIAIRVGELRDRKITLEETKREAERHRTELARLKSSLEEKKRVADAARREEQTLLRETQNEQAEYERLLAERRRKKELFEQELAQFEAELDEALDPSEIPQSRPGVLAWPLRNFVITQYFGNTEFATANPQIYSGKGHNGIDLGAPIGTDIRAPRDGVVLGTGDTDRVCGNASYGKWSLIRHDNGLSTLYAHLSVIAAKEGERVELGETIGYVGNTGYSTGPHLHFTVFATDAVRIGTLTSRVCAGAKYRIPLLSKSGGYLNPLSYLPGIDETAQR